MPALALAAALLAAQAAQGESAAQVVRHAVAAVEGDSAARAAARWEQRLARDSTDRLARLGVAVSAELAYQDTTAQRHYLALLSPDGPQDPAAGYAAVRLARRVAIGGNLRRSDSIAAVGVQIGRNRNDPVLTGEALVALGIARHRTQGAAAGLAILDTADQVLPEAELRIRALSRCARAQMYTFAGDTRSLELEAEGFELASQAGDYRARATCRAVRAGEMGRRGMLDTALVTYSYLIADLRKANDLAALASALQWRSHLYRSVGWLAKARRDAIEAIEHAEASGARAAIPWARSTLAWAALSLGDLATAAPQAEQAARQFLASGDRFATSTARSLQGHVAVAAGDYDAARTAYREALAAAESAGWAEAIITVNQALINAALRDGDIAAADSLVRVVDRVARAKGMLGYLGGNKYFHAVIAIRAGRLAEAEKLLQPRVDSAGQPQLAYLGAARLAEVYALQGRLTDAAKSLAGASEAMDEWRRTLGDRDLRLYALQLTMDASDPDLGIATVIRSLTTPEHFTTAFALIESIRARELADRLTRATADDPAGVDRAVRSLKTISLAELKQAIPDDTTALLRYVTGRGGEPSTLFAITWRQAHWIHLTNAAQEDSLAPLIARLGVLIESGEDARALGRTLGELLLDRALHLLDPTVRRVIVVPDGALHRVPFDALVMADDRYVIERFAVSYAPSANIAAALWSREHDGRRERALVVADPRFEPETNVATSGAEVFRDAVAGRGGLPRLRGSGREAGVVASYFANPTVRRRANASEAWLKREPLTEYGVLHFATHALVDEGSVTTTALALAPGEGEDGFLSAGEVVGLRLSADLVVLSACRTAGGALIRGEGVQGLSSPLLSAGARAVAASWWPIGDEATVRMTEAFYQAMADGRRASDALREAKLAALARGAPVREWAAFTIVGDPLVRPAVQQPSNLPTRWILAGAAVLVMLLAYGWAAKRKRRSAERS